MAKGTTSGSSLSQEERKRKMVTVTLSDEARAAIEEMREGGTKSGVIERLVLEGYARWKKNRR